MAFELCQIRDFMEGRPLDSPAGIVGWRDLSDHYSQRIRALKMPAAGGGAS